MENITIFIDNVGRMIIGSINEQSSNKTTLGIDNPCVINIQADQQTGQMSVQLLPFVFSEFVQNKEENITWKFNRTSIVASDNLQIEPRITQQYNQIISSSQTPAPLPEVTNEEEPEVVKLFDE
jgi:hypothetical protein